VLLPNDPQWNLDYLQLNACTEMHSIFRPKVIDLLCTLWVVLLPNEQRHSIWIRSESGCTEVYTTACIY